VSADGSDLPALRPRRSLAARIVAVVLLVLVGAGSLAWANVQQMRSLRGARFDLLTGIYLPFSDRLNRAHVLSVRIGAEVARYDLDPPDLAGPRPAALLNLQESLFSRKALVERARQPLDEAVAHPDRLGGAEALAALVPLREQIAVLEELVSVDAALDPLDVLADGRRQDEIELAFEALQEDARRVVRGQSEQVRAATQAAERFTILLTLAAGVISLLATLAVIFTLRPLRRLPDAVRRLAGGDWSSRIEVGERADRDDEVGRLAREFNRMAEALDERERRLIRQERLAAVGQMTAQITHEIRNPLSSMALSAELLEDELAAAGPEANKLLQRISSEIDRLTGITEAYLEFSRRPAAQREPLDFSRAVEDLVEFVRDEIELAGVALEVDVQPGVWVRGDPGQLRQALLNLVRNAREAAEEASAQRAAKTPGAGPPPRIGVGLDCKEDRVELVVSDNGSGIDLPEAQRERVFEAFFTRRAQGTGLGLPTVQQIVGAHEGEVSIAETGPEGTQFVVQLPACAPGAASVSSDLA
jgi:signal transduction histidine kinase